VTFLPGKGKNNSPLTAWLISGGVLFELGPCSAVRGKESAGDAVAHGRCHSCRFWGVNIDCETQGSPKPTGTQRLCVKRRSRSGGVRRQIFHDAVHEFFRGILQFGRRRTAMPRLLDRRADWCRDGPKRNVLGPEWKLPGGRRNTLTRPARRHSAAGRNTDFANGVRSRARMRPCDPQAIRNVVGVLARGGNGGKSTRAEIVERAQALCIVARVFDLQGPRIMGDACRASFSPGSVRLGPKRGMFLLQPGTKTWKFPSNHQLY